MIRRAPTQEQLRQQLDSIIDDLSVELGVHHEALIRLDPHGDLYVDPIGD
jgi:uncharacterized protein involved in exopolysaccharide biosynthesis